MRVERTDSSLWKSITAPLSRGVFAHSRVEGEFDYDAKVLGVRFSWVMGIQGIRGLIDGDYLQTIWIAWFAWFSWFLPVKNARTP